MQKCEKIANLSSLRQHKAQKILGINQLWITKYENG